MPQLIKGHDSMATHCVPRAPRNENSFHGGLSEEELQFQTFARDVLGPMTELGSELVEWKDMRGELYAKTEGFDVHLTLNADPAYVRTAAVKAHRAKSDDPAGTKKVSVALEYKGDKTSTPNLVFELVSMLFLEPSNRIQAGWGYTSEAGWLAYQFVDTKDVMFLPLPALRMYVLANNARFKATSTYNKTRGGYFTLNLLVKAEEVLNNIPCSLVVRTNEKAAQIEAAKDRPRFSSEVRMRTLQEAFSVMRKYPKGLIPNPKRGSSFDGLVGVPMAEGWGASPQLWWQDTQQQIRLHAMSEQLTRKDISGKSLIKVDEKYLPYGLRRNREALEHLLSLRSALASC